MQKRKERKWHRVMMSQGNMTDLIAPFLYQTKVLKPSEEVEKIVVDLNGDDHTYTIFIYYKEGGANNSAQLREGEQVGGHESPSSPKGGPQPSTTKSSKKGTRA